MRTRLLAAIGTLALVVGVTPARAQAVIEVRPQSLPVSGVIGQPLTYALLVIPGPGATVTGYAWTFGDGESAAGPSVSHAFTAAGEYSVTGTATVLAADGDQIPEHTHTTTAIRDPAVPVPRFPQTAGAGLPCPLVPSMCTFAQTLATAVLAGDSTTTLSLFKAFSLTCDAGFINDASSDTDALCYGARPGELRTGGYGVAGGNPSCGPACLGIATSADALTQGLRDLVHDAVATQVDGYGPGGLRMLGFLSPLSAYWGQTGENQLVIVFTAIEPVRVTGPQRQLIGFLVQADGEGNPLDIQLVNTVTLGPKELDQLTPPGYLSRGFLPWAPADEAEATAQASLGPTR